MAEIFCKTLLNFCVASEKGVISSSILIFFIIRIVVGNPLIKSLGSERCSEKGVD